MARSVILTNNFELIAGDVTDMGQVTSKDKRNNILSKNTDYMTLQFYINYLTTLQIKQAQWESYGYFDLGMVPLAMGPSAVHNLLRMFVIDLCRDMNLKYYDMYPAILLTGGYRAQDMEQDIWVFREDIANVVGTTELNFSVIEFFEREDVRVKWEEKVRTTQ